MAEQTRPIPAEPTDPDSVGDHLLRITAALALAGAGFVLVGGLADYFLFDEAIDDLNPKLEGNMLSWLSVVATFAGGLAAGLHALLLPARRRELAVLAGILAYLSLDDMIGLHERIGDNVDDHLPFQGPVAEHIEALIFLPVFAVAFLIVSRLGREVSARAWRHLRLGMVLLGTAIVVDFLSTVTNDLEEEGTAWPHAIRVAIEEALEMSGWILISGTLVTLLCRALLDDGGGSRASPGGQRVSPGVNF